MNMLKFNSQICTTKEQSKRLLELGLRPGTADMYYFWLGGNDYYLKVDIDDNPLKYNMDKTYIPAWSLHQLLELLPQDIYLDDYADTRYWLVIDPMKVIYKNSHGLWIYQCDEGGLYDKLINTIEWTIKNNHFNKEYLKL